VPFSIKTEIVSGWKRNKKQEKLRETYNQEGKQTAKAFPPLKGAP
jgi:hypothetical protein